MERAVYAAIMMVTAVSIARTAWVVLRLPADARPTEGLRRHQVGLAPLSRSTGGGAACDRCSVTVVQRRSGSSLLLYSRALFASCGRPCDGRPRPDNLELALAPERWHRPLPPRRSIAHHKWCLRRRPASNLHWRVPDLVRTCRSLHERSRSALDGSLCHPSLRA